VVAALGFAGVWLELAGLAIALAGVWMIGKGLLLAVTR